MKNLVKLLLLSLAFASTMDASGFKRLGQKMSKFAKLAPIGIGASLACAWQYRPARTSLKLEGSKNDNLSDELKFVFVNAMNMDQQNTANIYEMLQVLQLKIQWGVPISIFDISIDLCLMEKKNASLYKYCKQIQKEMGLDSADIEFYTVKDIVTGKIAGCVEPNITKDSTGKISNIKLIFVLKDDLESDFAEFTIRHEFAHIEHYLAQSEGIGLRPAFHQGIKYKDMNLLLMEQSADAAACGHYTCPECLQMMVDHPSRKGALSASINEQGYCVSERGYLSSQEMAEYVEALKRDKFPSCQKHSRIKIF